MQNEMNITSFFSFTLDQDSMLLVLKSLDGRLRPEEIHPAKLLGSRLTEMRATALEKTARQLRIALEQGN